MTVIYETALQPLDVGLVERVAPKRATRRRVARAVREWVAEHRIDLIVVGVLLVVGGYVHAAGMYASPARFDDEGTYTAYAWAVENLHRLGHYTYWYAHPPLGWIQISAWTSLTDGFDRAPYAVAAAREFMFVCKLVAIPLLYGLGRRLGYSRWAAALAVAIFAFSPLSVYFTRAALLDNIVTPWLVAAFFFAASPRRSAVAAVAAGLTCAVAVLTKETALLYLPAVLLLLWMNADRRNRRFTLTLFLSFFALLVALYPTYALVKNELLTGPGHVSLEWAVRWQLFERTGSGSIFDSHSTAHAVVRSWIDQDPWLPWLSLLLVVPGLAFRRSRAVALAFALQVAQLLRGGYLPYPYVIAMIPFAALTVAGVLDGVWRLVAARRHAKTAHPKPDVVDLRPARVPGAVAIDGHWQEVPPARRRAPSRWGTTMRRGGQVVVAAVCAWLVLSAGSAWLIPLRDLRTVSRDAGKAEALQWMKTHVPKADHVVVNDSLWVDLIRAGYPSSNVIWFTKLDVDPDVQLDGDWRAVKYIVLDHQDDLSLHIQADGRPSKDTMRLFPTIGRALQHSRTVGRYGSGRDAITVRQVSPAFGVTAPKPPPSGAAAGRTGKTGKTGTTTERPTTRKKKARKPSGSGAGTSSGEASQ